MIRLFNPDFAERDFGIFFGATSRALVGAFGGAVLAAAIASVCGYREDRDHASPPD